MKISFMSPDGPFLRLSESFMEENMNGALASYSVTMNEKFIFIGLNVSDPSKIIC